MSSEPQELEITDELIAERRAEQPGETPEDMTPWQRPITAFIDVLNLWAGRLFCLLLIPLIFAAVYEVVSRTAFGMLVANDMAEQARAWGLGPTLWQYDISRMLGGVLFMGAAGYALLRGVHIRADFLYRNWTLKTQATVDAVLYLGFYFPAMLFFFWSALDYTWGTFNPNNGFAYTGWERLSDSTWAPVLGPARAAMPLGALLLLLQGFPELFRAFHQMGKERERQFTKWLPLYFFILAFAFIGVFFPQTLGLIMPDAVGEFWKGLWGRNGVLTPDRTTIGLIMLGAMLFAIFVGFPISFTLVFLGFIFNTWGFNTKVTFFLLTAKTNETMLDDQLVAVPLFIFMGIMMEKAGLMERLFNAIQLMMSRVRGALFIAVLFVSTIFAAATGIVGASVTILGIMAARTMNKSGYDVKLAAGTITAGGTLGILIPPSIMLIVMGPVLEVPVTDLFRAAIVPGIMLAALYLIYSIGRCWLNPSLGPILPPEEQPETSPYYWAEVLSVLSALYIFVWLCIPSGKPDWITLILTPVGLVTVLLLSYKSSRLLAVGAVAFVALMTTQYSWSAVLTWISFLSGILVPIGWLGIMYAVFLWTRKARPGGFYYSDLWYEFFMGLVPPTVLIAFALGSILAGWATPVEASACGAFGAILLSLGYRKFTIPGGYDAMVKTLEITVLIMFLVAASNFFGAVFSNLGTPKMLTEAMLGFQLSPVWTMVLILALVFLLGWPLEWVPIVLIIVPIILPVVEQLDFGLEGTDHLVWFAILIAVCLQTAWLSPPVALSAYFLKGVVPEWDLKDIYFGMMQFMVIQLIGLGLIFYFPDIALWLPRYLDG